jgi:hypothetical protein
MDVAEATWDTGIGVCNLKYSSEQNEVSFG